MSPIIHYNRKVNKEKAKKEAEAKGKEKVQEV